MIRDRILFGTHSIKVREKLRAKGSTLTLGEAVEIARSLESSKAQVNVMAARNISNTDGAKPGTVQPGGFLGSMIINKYLANNRIIETHWLNFQYLSGELLSRSK